MKSNKTKLWHPFNAEKGKENLSLSSQLMSTKYIPWVYVVQIEKYRRRLQETCIGFGKLTLLLSIEICEPYQME